MSIAIICMITSSMRTGSEQTNTANEANYVRKWQAWQGAVSYLSIKVETQFSPGVYTTMCSSFHKCVGVQQDSGGVCNHSLIWCRQKQIKCTFQSFGYKMQVSVQIGNSTHSHFHYKRQFLLLPLHSKIQKQSRLDSPQN